MNNYPPPYTVSILKAIRMRIEQTYYCFKRVEEIFGLFSYRTEEPSEFNRQYEIVNQFYMPIFYINLSKLLRIFKNDPDIEKLLKSTPKQRMEFRKKVRDVFAKSFEYDEYDNTAYEYFRNSNVYLFEEFEAILEYFRSLLKKLDLNISENFESNLNSIDNYWYKNRINIEKLKM